MCRFSMPISQESRLPAARLGTLPVSAPFEERFDGGTRSAALAPLRPIPEALPNEAQSEQNDRDRPQSPEFRPGAPAYDAGRVEQENDAGGDDDQREKHPAYPADSHVNHLP